MSNTSKSDKAKRRPAKGAKKTPPRRTAPAVPSVPKASSDECWIYGYHPVRAALNNPDRQVLCIVGIKNQIDANQELLERYNGDVRTGDRHQLDSLFPKGALHQGIAALVKKLPETMLEDVLFSMDKDARFVVLDQITDPHNVGAILRSATVFGASGVIIQDRHAPQESAVLAKSASGALEHMPLIRVSNISRALDLLKEKNVWCIGLAGEAEETLSQTRLDGRIAIILGAEGAGLRRLTRAHCDVLARIPMAENAVGSLNVSNASAIALYEVMQAAQ